MLHARPNTLQRPIPNTRCDYLYWIPKEYLPQWKMFIQKELIVEPKNKYFQSQTETFHLYKETTHEIGIPRFLGRRLWGRPQHDYTTQGEPMAENVQFQGTLRNSEKYPQTQAVEQWISQGGNGLISLFCGAGKTVVSIYAAIQLRRKTIILVHEQHLVEQWKERLSQFAPQARIGLLYQNTEDIQEKDFVIAMIPSVSRRNYKGLDSFGLVIVDEAHHIAARTFCRSIIRFRPRHILALSATPYRNDGLTRIIHYLVGPTVFIAERNDTNPILIDQIVYPPDPQNPPREIRSQNKIIMARMVTHLIRDPIRNQLILILADRLMSIPHVKKIMLVSERRQHLKYLHEKLVQKGYDCGLYMGQMKSQQLEESKEKSVICASYGLASEALDISGLNAMILCTPWGRTQQVVGRLREDAQNTTRYVYDIVDPYSIFDRMAYKRQRIYRKLGYIVKRKEIKDL